MSICTPPPPASSIRPPISTPCSAPKRWRRDERPQDTRRRANLAAAPIGPASAADAGHRAGLAHAGERLLARQPAVRPAARAGRGQDHGGLLAAAGAREIGSAACRERGWRYV